MVVRKSDIYGMFLYCVLFHFTGIECMANDCEVKVPEDFLYSVLSKPDLRDRYSQLSFLEYVKVTNLYKCSYLFLST